MTTPRTAPRRRARSLSLAALGVAALACGAPPQSSSLHNGSTPPITPRREAPRAEPSVAPLPALVLRADHILDVRAGTSAAGAVVLRGSRIEAVGADVAIPDGACVIELGDVTLMPGLIDAHTHLLHVTDPRARESSDMLRETAEMSDAHRALRGAAHARSMLEHGITTVRDLGNAGDGADIALRDAIARGWVLGPRMFVTTRALSGPRGQFGPVGPLAHPLVDHEYAVIDGPDDARRAVRAAIAQGADGIKLIVGSETAITMGDPEVRAAIEEAHRAGRWVAAHATDDAAIRIAVLAGADSIEHAYEVSDETLALMAERGVAMVPTDFPLAFYEAMVRASPYVPEARRAEIDASVVAQVTASRERLARARRAGVRIVAGSDAYYEWEGRSRGEISVTIHRAYAEAGMSAIEIVRSATLHAAELLRRGDSLGELAPGRIADVIAVRGDPSTDATALERVALVVRDGRMIRNDLAPSECAPAAR